MRLLIRAYALRVQEYVQYMFFHVGKQQVIALFFACDLDYLKTTVAISGMWSEP